MLYKNWGCLDQTYWAAESPSKSKEFQFLNEDDMAIKGNDQILHKYYNENSNLLKVITEVQ